MQNSAKNIEITSNFAKKISPISKVNRAVMVQNFALELRDKTFAERYELLYYLALAVAGVSQLLSVWSSYLAVYTVVAGKAQGELGIAVTVLILCTIEAIKYALVRVSFGNIFSLRPVYPYPIILLALVWSAGSMYLCVSGSTEIAKDDNQGRQIATEQIAKEQALKTEISTIQKGDGYKVIVWDGAGKTAKVLTEAGKVLVSKRESELDSLRKTYQRKTQKFEEAQSQSQKKYNYFFAIFEGLFLFATAGAYYYKRTCAVENIVCEVAHEALNAHEVVQTPHEVRADLPTFAPEVARSTHEANELRAEFVREVVSPREVQSEVVRTNTAKQDCEAEVRSETSDLACELQNEPANEPTEAQSEADFLALIEKFTNGRRLFLEKYKNVVISILECEKRNLKPTECMGVCVEKHNIKHTTFYKIQSHLRQLKSEK